MRNTNYYNIRYTENILELIPVQHVTALRLPEDASEVHPLKAADVAGTESMREMHCERACPLTSMIHTRT